jgi:hypothetical protein
MRIVGAIGSVSEKLPQSNTAVANPIINSPKVQLELQAKSHCLTS